MRQFFVFGLACLVTLSTKVYADDEQLFLSISDAMESADFQAQLTEGVSFYFGDQPYPEPLESLGTYTSNKKTNGFGKSAKRACEWAMLSAMLTFQQRALTEGGNAVVDIVSYYDTVEYSSETDFECRDGSIMAGVVLRGRVVELPES